MAIYTVIDTNVIVSSLITKDKSSPTYKVINEVFEGSLIPIYSEEVFKEYKDVLNRSKFSFDKEKIKILLDSLSILGFCIEPAKRNIELIDKKDIPFYQILLDIEKYYSYLITGNKKHFPNKENIVSPSEFLEIINNRS